MNIYSKVYRELKNIYKFSDESNLHIKKELLTYENEINHHKTYVLKISDENYTNNIELSTKDLYEMILHIMNDNKIENKNQIEDFLQINYNESIEKTIERL